MEPEPDMTHHMQPLPLGGADLEASSSPAARGNASGHYRAREALQPTQTRLAVSLAIALRYRMGRAPVPITAPASSDV